MTSFFLIQPKSGAFIQSQTTNNEHIITKFIPKYFKLVFFDEMPILLHEWQIWLDDLFRLFIFWKLIDFRF